MPYKLSELRSSIKDVCGAAFAAGGGGMAGLTAAGAGAALKSPKSSSELTVELHQRISRHKGNNARVEGGERETMQVNGSTFGRRLARGAG